MDVLIFVAVAVGLVGGVLTGALWLSRAKPGATELVLLAAAAGREEAQLWSEGLRRAGIRARIQAVGDSAWVPTSYAYEVWVRPQDEARGRRLLGL